MKAIDPAVPFDGIPLPQLSSVSIGKSASNISRTMSDFAQKRSFDYDGYAYDFSLPEDLCQEDNQMPEFNDSFIGQNLILGENEGSSGHQAKFSEPNDGLLSDSYEKSYQHQDYWRNDPENIYLSGFHSEPQHDAQFPVAYPGCPIPVVSGLKFYQPYDQSDSEGNYDRISQVLSTSVANLHKLPNDFNKDSIEGKCIGKGYYFEKILHEAKNSGSYLGRSKNSSLMEKDAAHILETYDQPDSEGLYDRISQVLSTSVANLHKLPNDFNKDSVEGKCVGKGYHFEKILHDEKDAAHIFETYDQLDLEGLYDRISQVLSTSVANLHKLPNDFNEDSVEGKCIGRGYHFEGILQEAKNSGSYLGRSKNSNLMEKDAAHIFETYDQLDLEGLYDRISQVLSTLVANLHKLPNDFNEDSVEGKCVGKGYHFEKILHEEKDAAHIFETYDQLDLEGLYDRISQVLSTLVANLHKLPNDFNEDSVEEKCIGRGYHFEGILQEVKNSGSYLGRSKNSNLMEKDAAHIFETYDQLDLEGLYDRISQVLSTSVANLHKLPNDFNKDFIEGKCIGKGYHFEDILQEAKNSGSYLGRSKNSNLMEKDVAHIFETNVGHFSSGHNAPGIDDLIQSLLQTEIQKQPVQNASKTAETEENYNNFPYCWSFGEQLKVELLQAISSLTAHIGRLEIQVENLTHQVQDMSNKLSDEKKLNTPTLDHSGNSKAVFEESKITSTADETPETKLFIETEASYQKLEESASDWEIV